MRNFDSKSSHRSAGTPTAKSTKAKSQPTAFQQIRNLVLVNSDSVHLTETSIAMAEDFTLTEVVSLFGVEVASCELSELRQEP